MSIKIDYIDKTISPNIDAIHEAVAASGMADKTIVFCHWDEICEHCDPSCNGHLEVWFTNELIAGDKTILDGIIADNS